MGEVRELFVTGEEIILAHNFCGKNFSISGIEQQQRQGNELGRRGPSAPTSDKCPLKYTSPHITVGNPIRSISIIREKEDPIRIGKKPAKHPIRARRGGMFSP